MQFTNVVAKLSRPNTIHTKKDSMASSGVSSKDTLRVAAQRSSRTRR